MEKKQEVEFNESSELFKALKGSGFKTIQKTIEDAKDFVDKSRKGERIVFPTKFPRLNKQLMGGFQPGKMYVVAGRPGSGKSQFSNQLLFDTLDVAVEQGKKVAVIYWSFEMPGEQQMLRIASGDCGVGVYDLISDKSSVSYKEFVETINKYSSYNVVFKNIPETIVFFKNMITRFCEDRKDYTLINVVDHTRLFKGGNKDEIQRLADVANMLMDAQASYKTITVVLSQLNKNIESNDRAKEQYQPQLTDLFGSDSLSQNTHVCMMLNRPLDMYGIEEEYCGESTQNLMAVHITKNRDGYLGLIPFDTHYPSFKITERSN